ncbi:unnamed protein product, partial [marine sediment metagenome]
EPLIQEIVKNVGSGYVFKWSFTMPPTGVNITINAGHVE